MALEDTLHASLGLYMRAPGWLRALGGNAYRSLPARLRHGARHPEFLADAQREPGSVGWHAVAARLEATLQAAASVPAFASHATAMRDQRVDVMQRLRALPLVSKADIKADLDAWLHPDAAPSQRLPMFTGGSTAEPMRFYLHRHVSRVKESAYLDHIERSLLGAQAGDWALSLRGRTVGSAAAPSGRLWTTEPIKRHLLFSSDHLEARHMPVHTTALDKLRPRLVHAFPSALFPLARWLADHPLPGYTEQVAGVLLTSENIYDFQHALFERVFPRARIVAHYGHSERVLLATAAARGAPASFYPLYGLPELVDAEGRCIDEPGVLGEIVGTSFDNHVMPFLRYRTGDMGMWHATPGYHGNACFTMRRIEGRRQEFVVCDDHRLVSITTLGAAHFHELSQVDALQFEQHTAGRLRLRLVCPRGIDADSRARIAAAVREKTQGGCEVELELVSGIERTARGKHRMLLQHLDLGSYLGAAITPDAEDRLLAGEDETDAHAPPMAMPA
jgi:phenylacetate-CoA ligase